jgi:hypothetical protein
LTSIVDQVQAEFAERLELDAAVPVKKTKTVEVPSKPAPAKPASKLHH